MTRAQSSSELLQSVFETRKQRNPAYTARAFARDCGISPTSLSHLLRSRVGLSRRSASSVVERLKLSHREGALLKVLVEYETAKTPKSKQIAMLKRLRFMSYFEGEERDRYHLIADWYHLPVCELTALEGFRSDPAWIARALGITVQEAEDAVARLLRLGLLIEEGGKLRKATPNVVIPDGNHSESIRVSHRAFLQMAEKAMDQQAMGRRFFSTTVMGCDSSDLPLVKSKLRDFRQGLMVELEQSKKPDSVYALGIQFFRVDRDAAEK